VSAVTAFNWSGVDYGRDELTAAGKRSELPSSMRGFCADPDGSSGSEIQRHVEGEVQKRISEENVIDTSTQGLYVYPPDAIAPSCGSVSLEIFSEKDPNTPITQPVETATVERVWSDFEPYRKEKKEK
jgi:hypothetical protein